jgi:fructose-bisphosphate aldolase, class I
VLNQTFRELRVQRVELEGMILKPNMAISGKKCAKQASVEEVAEKTIRMLKACVPAAVPGIAFLSGGQSDEEATAHLNAMNRIGHLPWKLTFSYGRALQAAPQKAWSGKSENAAAGQRAFAHRARMNALASKGEWVTDMEKKAA